MRCDYERDRCRREHIAIRLAGAELDGAGYEARCPVCGHDSFRVSRPDHSRRHRNIWTCACKGQCRERCRPGEIRAALLRLGIGAGCLGIYDGINAKEIPSGVARDMDRTINDILATPGLKLQDVRILLAEAQGRKPPSDYGGYVQWAKSIGLAQQQAYEAARREVSRPADSPSVPEGGVVDTSRNTQPGSDVKPRRSQPRDLTEKVEPAYRISKTQGDMPDSRLTEKVKQTPLDEPDTVEAIKNLYDGGVTGRRIA